jgi:gamma-glutamylputrescine oxidase
LTLPYWLDEPPPELPRRVVANPDVEVVGGGVTGCSCALALANAGVRVRLHEAREIATGASGRNGGFALRGTAGSYDAIRAAIGREAAVALWRRTEQALDRVEETAGDAFRRTGSLRLAADADERAELRKEFDALGGDGFAAEWVDEPLAGFAAAILHPRDGAVHPARWVRRLALRAAEAGVEIREHSRVESLESLEADQAVVATDGYPSGLLGRLEGLIVPTRGQMLATEPLSERLFERPHYSRHGFDYWQQTPDGRLLAGGFRDTSLASEFTTEEEVTRPIQRALDALVTRLVGRPVAITHRWAGLFGLVLDFLPVVGCVPGNDRVWVAGGYSGHGNVLGLLCGEIVAEAILGRRPPELALFEPARLL